MSTPQANRPPACVPTWHGHIETTRDALLIFQGCFDGTLSHCSRRPHDRERNSLIVSGNVFVYEEATSGIKRWTDGIPWSPSRILTNFLIYRQLNSPFPPGEKKRATKRTPRPRDPYGTPTSSGTTPTADDHKQPFAVPPPVQDSPLAAARKDDESPEKDSNRGLVGSLVDSYEFKEGGLLKKTMTVVVRNVHHHLVSYYSLDDAKGTLRTPREDHRVKDLVISPELAKQPKFKFSNLDDAGDGTFESQEQPHYGGYYQPHGNHYYPYPYGASPGYQQHPAGAYAPNHPPQHYSTLPPSNSTYAPAPGQYPQYHPQQQYYQQPVQGGPQYYQGYPQQHYQGHHTPAHPPVTPVKQETAPSATPQYNYHNTSAPSAPVSDVYAAHQTNGSSAPPEDENVVPATTQPAQSQTWPMHSYSQQWARPEGANYPTYRPSA